MGSTVRIYECVASCDFRNNNLANNYWLLVVHLADQLLHVFKLNALINNMVRLLYLIQRSIAIIHVILACRHFS